MAVKAPIHFEKRATVLGGVYWRSNASRKDLRANLRSYAASDMFKIASIGGDQEQGFEQSFSSLAYTYLKDKAPRLLDFIVGFQLVDRNEDSTKAVGLFGFKVGDQWLYAPVFFLNGDLKGHELLYIKNRDTFVPMKENWVNYLISRKPHVLGEPSDKNTFELGGMWPNLTKLTRPPMGTKYGSDEPGPIDIAGWARPALPMIAALALKQAKALYPSIVKTAAALDFPALTAKPFQAAFAPYAAKFDLGTALGSNFALLKTAYELYRSHPVIKTGFDKFYGPDFFRKTAVTLKAAGDSLIKPVIKSGTKSVTKLASDSIIPETKVDPRAGLEIIASDTMKVDNDQVLTENRPELTDSERERLLKDTVLIKDKRDPQSVSIAYNTQTKLELINPNETGLFEVLEKPGTFDELLVIVNPHSGRGREDFSIAVRKSDPRSWLNIHHTNLFAKSCDCPVRADFVKWVEGLTGTKESLKVKGTYIAVHENGSGTVPFEVLEDYGDGRYRVSFKDYMRWDYRRHNSAKSTRPWDYEDHGYSSWDARVFINNRKGSKLRSTNGELSIPDTYKIITVQDPPKPKKEKDLVESCCISMSDNEGGSKETPIKPGNLLDVQMQLYKQAEAVKIHDTGSEIWLSSRLGHERMTKTAALVCLVRDHGLRETQARLMLKEAAALSPQNRAVRYMVKYAYGYGGNLQPGPTSPPFPPPMTGIEQNGPNSVPAIYPQEEFAPVDSLQASLNNPQIYDPFYQPDPSAMQVAQQASAGGQKEVFDASMLSGLLKSVRQDSLVDRYLGDLMKALDALLRILFLFYWHNEEFTTRYGKNEIPELEDGLRNAAESLGDITLFLMEKTVHGGTNLNMSGVGNPSEPSIDEVAGN